MRLRISDVGEAMRISNGARNGCRLAHGLPGHARNPVPALEREQAAGVIVAFSRRRDR